MFLTFEEIAEMGDVSHLIGKKAESLITMTSHGLPVPGGGCITTDGFNEFILHNKLELLVQEIRNLMQERVEEQRIKDMAKEARELILQGNIPKVIKVKLIEFQKKHPKSHFAVRSSGTKEDLQGASFAGQYSSILNVRTTEHLELAIKQCWASLFNVRVLNYCINKKIDFMDMSLSVILQEMIPSEKSGVIFSVNPMKGYDKQVLLEACFGVGEALVGGEVTPDQYYYNWYDDVEDERVIADKKVASIAIKEPPFLTSIENPKDKRNKAVLSKKEVQELAQIAVKIQSIYGFPVDIEWAKYSGKFYIVQSRPITTINYTGIEGEWTTADFKDGGVSATVCTPFMWSLYDFIWERSTPDYAVGVKFLSNKQAKEILWGDMFYGRPYWSLTGIKQALSQMPGYIERDYDESIGIKPAYEGEGFVSKTNLKTIFKAVKVLLALSKSFKELEKSWPDFRESQNEKLMQLDVFNYSKMSDDEFLSFYKKFILEEYQLSESTYFVSIYASSNKASLFKESFDKLKGDVNYLNLISGLSDLSHLIPNFKLWDVKEIIKNNKEAYKFWKDSSSEKLVELWRSGSIEHCIGDVRDYIEEFKFHSTHELDIRVPRHGEDPKFVMDNIKNSLDLESNLNPKLLNEKQSQTYLEEMKNFKKSLPFFKRKGMVKSLEKLRKFLWWREELRDLSTQYYYWVRKFTLVTAKQFVKKNIINTTDDIFFLTMENINNIIDKKLTANKAKGIVEKNRLYYDSFREYKNPNEIGSRFLQGSSEHIEGEALKGLPCSPGIITGKVRLIKDIFDSDRIEKGDILITKFTDPGWTPKFSLIAAVATETGGLLSHAAVISREYGIPAVLAVENITDILKDGQEITIDGNSGEIIIHD